MRRVWHQVNGKLVPGPAERRCQNVVSVMPDIEPYRTIRGELITSRSHHREMLKRTGMVELGNEYDAYIDAQRPYYDPGDMCGDIKEAIEECRAGKGTYGGKLDAELKNDIDLTQVETV